jgi:hypothetical protein
MSKAKNAEKYFKKYKIPTNLSDMVLTILHEELKCCGIDCCEGFIGGGGGTDSQVLSKSGGTITISNGNTITLGATQIQVNAGTDVDNYLTPLVFSQFFSLNYIKELITITTTATNHVISLANTLKSGYNNFILVSKNGQIQYEGILLNGYTVSGLNQITLTEVFNTDLIEVRYFKQ